MSNSAKALSMGLLMALVGGLVFVAFGGPEHLAYALERGRAQARHDAAVKDLERLGPQIEAVRSMSAVFNAISRLVEPSVVHITSERTTAAPTIPPDLRRFFEQNPDQFGFPFPGPRRSESTGSGVVISKDGYVLTNNHVVAGATRVTVKLGSDGGETFDAKVVGADPRTDVAVIKIDGPGDLIPAELGDSDTVRVGDWVLAIGSPFGLDRSMTAGIISATGRANVGIADYEDFIQTDASINPGNSGGPLVDMSGRVIGINTAIASRSGGNQGIGFAIPINMIKKLLPRLEKGETIARGYLGVLIQPLTRKLAESFSYDSTKGALVSQIMDESPSKGKLQVGDILLSVNGKEVADPNELRTAVADLAPGSTARLGVFRDGKKSEVEVKLGTLPSALSAAGPSAEPPDRELASRLLGIEVQTLTAEQATRLGYPKDRQGALVVRVDPDSEAAREGLSAGELITQAHGRPVSSAEELTAILAEAKDQSSVRLLVTSPRGQTRFLLLPLARD